MLNITKIKKDFPVFKQYPNLVYLDSAASSLKPSVVIEKINHYYSKLGANVHRGVYKLSYESTDLYEEARQKIADFLNASFNEIVFTRGTSASLNLVASSYGEEFINEGDEVITTKLEHHSSHLPWFNICQKKNAKLIYLPLSKEGFITVEGFKKVITPKTKVLAITYVSNVLGYITPLKEIIKEAHKHNITVIVDAAQAVGHMEVDVKDLDCDFLAFSGHKICGPTGIGILYGKKELLEKMNPIEFGGDMADLVCEEGLSYKAIPYKFETGTPLIASAIGLGEACCYLNEIGLSEIHEHSKFLALKAYSLLKEIKGVKIYNQRIDSGVISFNIDNVHPHDAASVLDQRNVCIRAGHHCAQLVSKLLGVNSTIRASFYLYNTLDDVYALVAGVKEALEFFTRR